MEPLLVVVLIAIVLLVLTAGLVVARRRPAPPDERPGAGAATDLLEGPPEEDSPAATIEAPPQVEAPPEVTEPTEPTEAPGTPTVTPPVEEAPSAPPTVPEAPTAPPVDEPVVEEISLGERFKRRLTRTRNVLGASVADLFGAGVSDEAWEGLEEALIGADVGIDATLAVVEELRTKARDQGVTDAAGVVELLKLELRAALGTADRTLGRRTGDDPTLWLVTGVNGTGKTTTIGKLSAREGRAGRSVVLGAADTFRAAASEQLGLWADRTDARLVAREPGADPASVAYDAYNAGKATDANLVIIDTAGRLHNKTELMDELGKVKRVLEKQAGHVDETLLVLDATTGQNGIQQARAFLDAVEVTGIVLTKLDGTSKGGVVIAVQRELEIPVKLVGLGEDVDDLAIFDPDAFVEGLFAEFELA